jgi:LPXTG-site transpeptidase (sortase) family protein
MDLSGTSIAGRRGLGRFRQRLLLGVGVALFAAGIGVLAVGLVGYFDKSGTVTQPVVPTYTDLIPDPPASIDEVEGLPVAIPYNNPYSRITAPLRIMIDALGVDAPVVTLGLDSEGVPEVPLNGNDVAWYDFSTKPGQGSNAVFAGHINWERKLGAFGKISKLKEGDTIRLVSDDGREFTYEVFANFAVDPEDPDSLKVMAPTDNDIVTLITCGGTWIPDPSERFGGNYTDRTIVQARLVHSTDPPAASDTSGG